MRNFVPLLNKPALIGFLSLISIAARSADPDSKEAFWRSQIEAIHLGMQRHLVDEYLPPRGASDQKYSKTGWTYVISYPLDKHWSATIAYDRSGYSEKNNAYSVMGFPRDKVIRRPILIRQEYKIDERMFPWKAPKSR